MHNKEGGMTVKLHDERMAVDSYRYWVSWFAGFESRKKEVEASADDFLPDLLKRSRALKAEMAYLNSVMACR